MFPVLFPGWMWYKEGVCSSCPDNKGQDQYIYCQTALPAHQQHNHICPPNSQQTAHPCTQTHPSSSGTVLCVCVLYNRGVMYRYTRWSVLCICHSTKHSERERFLPTVLHPLILRLSLPQLPKIPQLYAMNIKQLLKTLNVEHCLPN